METYEFGMKVERIGIGMLYYDFINSIDGDMMFICMTKDSLIFL